MRDKQYFTVEDLDSAHRAGVAYGITNSGNSNRVERALELIRNKQSGTKVAYSKAKDASKLLLDLGLSGAAIAAATSGGKGNANSSNDSSSNSSSSSPSSYNKGKAGTDLPLGLTIGKDGTATPAIDGKVASILGMVGKLATGVNPLIGALLGVATTFLSKDLEAKAKDFNTSEEAKFQSMLDNTDKDYSQVTGLLGISDTLGLSDTASDTSYSQAKDSSAANSNDNSAAGSYSQAEDSSSANN